MTGEENRFFPQHSGGECVRRRYAAKKIPKSTITKSSIAAANKVKNVRATLHQGGKQATRKVNTEPLTQRALFLTPEEPSS